jgi:hypothetical protein
LNTQQNIMPPVRPVRTVRTVQIVAVFHGYWVVIVEKESGHVVSNPQFHEFCLDAVKQMTKWRKRYGLDDQTDYAPSFNMTNGGYWASVNRFDRTVRS